MADAYEAEARTNHLALVIADSDRAIPGGAVGSTARALRNTVKRLNGWLIDMGGSASDHVTPLVDVRVAPCSLVLPARMLENLLPLEMYEKALPPPIPESLKVLCCRAPSPQWFDHVHLKKGLRLRSVAEMPVHEQAFWKEACLQLWWPKCRQAAVCSTVEDCRCEVVPALSEGAAEQVLKWMTKERIDTVARLWGLSKTSTVPASAALWQLADWIMSWGLAPPVAKEGT